MNSQNFLNQIKNAFLENTQNLEDSFANDEFLQKALWVRLDNNQFFIKNGKIIDSATKLQNSNLFFAKNTELEIYKIPTSNDESLNEAIQEIAKTFYDIENRSYSFILLDSPIQIFSKYVKNGDANFLKVELGNDSIETIAEIYSGEDNALYLSLGHGVLFVYFFTFFPNDDFLN